jgi:hypothetical protein
MPGIGDVKERMEIIGSDGNHVGTVDRVEGQRIKLTKKDSGPGHKDHHHYLEGKLVSAIEGNKVKLSIPAAQAMKAEQEA